MLIGYGCLNDVSVQGAGVDFVVNETLNVIYNNEQSFNWYRLY